MQLVDQWRVIETNLPVGWEDVRLTLTTEQPEDMAQALQVLGPMSVGRMGETLVFHVRRAGGGQGPEAARRLFARLDEKRVWSLLEAGPVVAKDTALSPAPEAIGEGPSIADSWRSQLAELPLDWGSLLCEIEIESSDLLPRVALLCAPVNPTRDRERLAFMFRCAKTHGYGVSPGMAARCFERCDDEGIAGRTSILRVLSETDNVATQGPVFYVGGKPL